MGFQTLTGSAEIWAQRSGHSMSVILLPRYQALNKGGKNTEQYAKTIAKNWAEIYDAGNKSKFNALEFIDLPIIKLIVILICLKQKRIGLFLAWGTIAHIIGIMRGAVCWMWLISRRSSVHWHGYRRRCSIIRVQAQLIHSYRLTASWPIIQGICIILYILAIIRLQGICNTAWYKEVSVTHALPRVLNCEGALIHSATLSLYYLY